MYGPTAMMTRRACLCQSPREATTGTTNPRFLQRYIDVELMNIVVRSLYVRTQDAALRRSFVAGI